jgi:hypothetical protein
MNRSTAKGGTWAKAGLLALACAALALPLGPLGAAKADSLGETRESPRFTLTPGYLPGKAYRVEMHLFQSTVTALSEGRFRRPFVPFDWSSYDGLFDLDALVRIDRVNSHGDATGYSVTFHRLRMDLPDPLQNHAYRMRVRERKAKNLSPFAHPLEGETIRVDGSRPEKRYFRVFRGAPGGHGPREVRMNANRYPEILPLLHEIVRPSWTPPDSVRVGARWTRQTDHLTAMTRVLSRTPWTGRVRATLAEVSDDVAAVDTTTTVSESTARVEMTIQARTRIEFDLARRQPTHSTIDGEVVVTSPTSSMRGSGHIHGTIDVTEIPESIATPVTQPTPPAPAVR